MAPRTSGFQRNATRESPGTISLSSSRRFPTKLRRDTAEACHIAAGARETRHEPGPDRIGAQHHHNGRYLSLSFDCRDHPIRGRHDHVHFETHQLPRELRKSFGSAFGVSKLQDDSFPFDVAKRLKTLPECFEIVSCGCWSARENESDPRYLLRRLLAKCARRSSEYTCAKRDKQFAATTHHPPD